MSSLGQVASRLGAIDLTVRPMSAGDRTAVLSFADGLPDHDLLFLRRDIRDTEVVDEWIAEIESGQIVTLLATVEDEMVGYASIDRSQLRWSSHVAEIRVVISETARGKGLGRLLVEQAFQAAVAAGIEK
ncbi:MAG: GNAT family N-acetyltransferase, partial [Acidobacteria bacterium]|nr:GNAT family N-acetyltransferase [Acidobacteriota bacterium]